MVLSESATSKCRLSPSNVSNAWGVSSRRALFKNLYNLTPEGWTSWRRSFFSRAVVKLTWAGRAVSTKMCPPNLTNGTLHSPTAVRTPSLKTYTDIFMHPLVTVSAVRELASKTTISRRAVYFLMPLVARRIYSAHKFMCSMVGLWLQEIDYNIGKSKSFKRKLKKNKFLKQEQIRRISHSPTINIGAPLSTQSPGRAFLSILSWDTYVFAKTHASWVWWSGFPRKLPPSLVLEPPRCFVRSTCSTKTRLACSKMYREWASHQWKNVVSGERLSQRDENVVVVWQRFFCMDVKRYKRGKVGTRLPNRCGILYSMRLSLTDKVGRFHAGGQAVEKMDCWNPALKLSFCKSFVNISSNSLAKFFSLPHKLQST